MAHYLITYYRVERNYEDKIFNTYSAPYVIAMCNSLNQAKRHATLWMNSGFNVSKYIIYHVDDFGYRELVCFKTKDKDGNVSKWINY